MITRRKKVLYLVFLAVAAAAVWAIFFMPR